MYDGVRDELSPSIFLYLIDKLQIHKCISEMQLHYSVPLDEKQTITIEKISKCSSKDLFRIILLLENVNMYLKVSNS